MSTTKPVIGHPQQIPRGGMFEIRDRLTGVTVKATTFDQVMERIYEERKVNGAPIGMGLRDEVETWVCEQYPDACINMDPDFPRVRSLTLSDIIHGTKVMIAHKLAGSPLVDRAEAERRAQICMKCQFNVVYSKPCAGICPELQAVVQAVTGHTGTQYDKFLNACGICGCLLMSAIWLPVDIQYKGVTDAQARQFKNVQVNVNGTKVPCWKQLEV